MMSMSPHAYLTYIRFAQEEKFDYHYLTLQQLQTRMSRENKGFNEKITYKMIKDQIKQYRNKPNNVGREWECFSVDTYKHFLHKYIYFGD